MLYKKVPVVFLNCSQVLGRVPLLLLCSPFPWCPSFSPHRRHLSLWLPPYLHRFPPSLSPPRAQAQRQLAGRLQASGAGGSRGSAGAGGWSGRPRAAGAGAAQAARASAGGGTRGTSAGGAGAAGAERRRWRSEDRRGRAQERSAGGGLCRCWRGLEQGARHGQHQSGVRVRLRRELTRRDAGELASGEHRSWSGTVQAVQELACWRAGARSAAQARGWSSNVGRR
jgi:hypothetical protein